jgi:membrane AbrB-like protein
MAIFATMNRPVIRFPLFSYRLAQSMIGVMLSFSITAKSLQTIAANWLPVVVLVLAMLVLASLNGIVLCRFTNLKPGTALLGTLPGGAGEMIAMSDTLGADVRLVTVMQYGRLLAILATISTAVVSQLKRLGLFVFLSNVLLLAASALLAFRFDEQLLRSSIIRGVAGSRHFLLSS